MMESAHLKSMHEFDISKPKDISLIENALCVVLDPNSNPSQRNYATDFCEKLKESPEAISIALTLLTQTDTSFSAKNFGFQLLKYAVNNKTVALNSDTSLGRMIWSFIPRIKESCSFDSLSSRIILSKLSSLISEIVLKEWPQTWTDFSTQIQHEILKGDSLSINSITYIVNTLYSSGNNSLGSESEESSSFFTKFSLSEERKSFLKEAFESQLLVFCLEYITPRILNSLQYQHISKSKAICECFIAFAPWAPIPAENLIAITHLIFSTEKHEALHFDLLNAMSMSTGVASTQIHPVYLEWLFSDEAIESYKRCISRYNFQLANASSSEIMTEEHINYYGCFCLFIEWLVKLGVSYMTKMKSDRLAHLMLQLSEFPLILTSQSLLLRSTICMFWMNITRIEGLFKKISIPVQNLITSVIYQGELNIAQSSKFIRSTSFNYLDFPENSDSENEEANTVPGVNNSIDEFTEVTLTIKNRYSDVLGNLAGLPETWNTVKSILDQFQTQAHALLNDKKVSNQLLTQWTTLIYLIDGIIRGLSQSDITFSNAVELISAMILIRPQDPRVALTILQVIRSALQIFGAISTSPQDNNKTELGPIVPLILNLSFDNLEISARILQSLTPVIDECIYYAHVNCSTRAAALLVKLVDLFDASLLTPSLPLIMDRFNCCIGLLKLHDRRLVLEFILEMSVKQQDLADITILKQIGDAIRAEVDLRIQRPSSEDKILEDTLTMMSLCQDRAGMRYDHWSRWIYDLIINATKSFSNNIRWLVAAWKCLKNLTIIETLAKQCLPYYLPSTLNQLLKEFLRTLITERAHDQTTPAIVVCFIQITFNKFREMSSTSISIEFERELCTLWTTLISLTIDLLCYNGNSPIPDYHLDLVLVKNHSSPASEKTTLALLVPTELAKQVILFDKVSDYAPFAIFIFEKCCLSTLSFAMDRSISISHTSMSKSCQALLHYLPAMYTGQLFGSQAAGLDFIYNKLLPLLQKTIFAPQIREEQALQIALITEILKWTWLLGLDPHLPSWCHGAELKQRLLYLSPETNNRQHSNPCGTMIFANLKTQRKLVKRVIIDRHAATEAICASSSNTFKTCNRGKSVLSRLRNFIQDSNTFSNFVDESASNADIGIIDLFNSQ